MRNNPERLAWTVLIASFAVFIALVVGVPTTVSAVLNQSTIAAGAYVRLQAGRIQTYAPPSTDRDARVVSLEGREIDEGSVIIVDPDASSQGLFTITPPGEREPIVSAQIYGGSRIQVWRARSPRFALSSASDESILVMSAGRARFTVAPRDGRPARIQILTPYGRFTLNAGAHTIEVANGEARAITREGSLIAEANAPGAQPLTLRPGERTALRDGTLQAVRLTPERNLVRNNTFVADFTPWETEIRSAAGRDGRVLLDVAGGVSSILLDRVGDDLNWGRTGVFQIVNENVADRQSLRLRVDFRIVQQEIKVCGNLGSECALMVNITYIDRSGNQREWLQGFYADGTPAEDLPDVVRENPTNKHVAKALGTRESFESENLLQGGMRDAQLIQRIRVYAEGHTVSTQIYAIDLLVQD